MKIYISIVLAILMSSCSSLDMYHSEYYYYDTDSDILEFAEEGSFPRIHQTDNYKQAIRDLRRLGYTIIGASYFKGRLEDLDGAKWIGRRTRATDVVIFSKKTGTDSYDVSQMNNAFAKVGAGLAGGGTTQIEPQQQSPSYVSYSTGEQGAFFFAKNKPSYYPNLLGIHLVEIPLHILSKAPFDKGIIVDVIVKNSPASNSNLREGDFITHVNSQPVDLKSFHEILARQNGLVMLKGYNSEAKSKTIKFNLKKE